MTNRSCNADDVRIWHEADLAICFAPRPFVKRKRTCPAIPADPCGAGSHVPAVSSDRSDTNATPRGEQGYRLEIGQRLIRGWNLTVGRFSRGKYRNSAGFRHSILLAAGPCNEQNWTSGRPKTLLMLLSA